MRTILGNRALLGVLAFTAALLALPVSSAFAGRLLVTGHDAEYHCSGGSQCHYVKVATDYVRGGAPDPSKPVLVLDTDDLDFPQALDNVESGLGGSYPRVVMDPKDAAFATTPLNTGLYSAILIASDTSCGGCDLNQSGTEDSDAINARTADIATFFNEGGGVYANAGAQHGNGADPDDVFYNFVPIPVGGVAVTSPFTLTADGIAFGLENPSQGIGTNNDINCCATHNSFAEPTNPLIKVLERDAENFPETLSAEAFIVGGQLVSSLPTTPAAPAPVAPKAKPTAKASIRSQVSGCTRTTATARVSGQNISTVTYSLDGKKVKKAKGNKSSVTVNAKNLKSGVHRITAKITFTGATGAKSQTKRISFSRCARKAAKPKFTG